MVLDAMAFDEGGNLWATTATHSREVLRIPAQELAREGDRITVTPEAYTATDGLSGEVGPILHDREGNVWLGTVQGLDRLSHTNVLHGPQKCGSPALAAGEGGALWIACRNVSGVMSKLSDGTIVNQPRVSDFPTVYADRPGSVWFGGRTTLEHLENGRSETIPLPPRLHGTEVQALASDSGGGLWVSVVRRGVFRYAVGQWSDYGDVDALPRGPAIVEVADKDGTLWFGYPGSRIARLRGKSVQLFGATQGLAVGNVLSILASGDDVWVGGGTWLGASGPRALHVSPQGVGDGAPGNLGDREGSQRRFLAKRHRRYLAHTARRNRACQQRLCVPRSFRQLQLFGWGTRLGDADPSSALSD